MVVICPECKKEHDGTWSRKGYAYCGTKCYRKAYSRENWKKHRKEKPQMKMVSEDEAYLNLFFDIVDIAVRDARYSRARRTRTEARRWLVNELPYWLSLFLPWDYQDIARCRTEIDGWIKTGFKKKSGLYKFLE